MGRAPALHGGMVSGPHFLVPPPSQVREGLHYNPYFPGGSIAMPKMIVDGGVEYDDGTPSSASQQAKDVTTFLTWSCNPFQVGGRGREGAEEE